MCGPIFALVSCIAALDGAAASNQAHAGYLGMVTIGCIRYAKFTRGGVEEQVPGSGRHGEAVGGHGFGWMQGSNRRDHAQRFRRP